MAGSFLNFPFDDELFLMQWQAAQDPTKTALLTSGVMVEDATIRSMIANGSNLFTIPFYDVLGGNEQNYDGMTDITEDETSGTTQSGVVYGRMKSWRDRDFVVDFNSGADPMKSIVAQTSKWWDKKRQNRLVGILNGLFSITDDGTDNWDAWQLHTTNIATKTSSASAANKLDEASAADAIQKANGDNSGIYTMAVMHSKVAANLARLQLLQYRKYTDPLGIERTVNIADYNGLTVIIDDGVPVATSSSATGEKEYTTFLMGTGCIRHASAPVIHPVEHGRESKKFGGYDYIINRIRETMHPNGFSFVNNTALVSNPSPSDAVLTAAASYNLVADAKLIPLARLVTNG